MIAQLPSVDERWHKKTAIPERGMMTAWARRVAMLAILPERGFQSSPGIAH
jgi:hypothetical protein